MSLPSFSVKNKVMANILMVLIIVGGLIMFHKTRREMFPYVNPDRVFITTTFKGASPEEIEREVTVKIEDAVKGIDGIDTVTSYSSENTSVVIVRLRQDVKDVNNVYEDIRAEVDKITDFPMEADRPVVKKMRFRLPVINLVLYGDVNPLTLKDFGEKIKLDLQSLKGIGEVFTLGLRDRQFKVEVNNDLLEKYNLSIPMITQAIRRRNINLTAGKIKTSEKDYLLRVLGEVQAAHQLKDTPLRVTRDGKTLTLGQVAKVVEGLDEEGPECRFNGQNAITFTINKTRDEDALQMVTVVRKYASGLKRRLPPGLKIALSADLSFYIKDRLKLMTKNGLQGLILVFIALTIFLNFRASFWTALGIPVSFLGAFIFFKYWGLSLNMVSMFGIIMVVGMVVDDAIVVCENVYRKIKGGQSSFRAAVEGTEEVMWPVVATVTTTIAAFLPLLLMTGTMGKFMSVVPIVVSTILAVSLFECMAILPAHLMDSFKNEQRRQTRSGKFHRALVKIDQWREDLHQWLLGYYKKILRKVVNWRYVAVAIIVSATVVSVAIGLALLNFTVFPKIDADYFYIKVDMPVGTSKAKTVKALTAIDDAILSLHDPAIKYVTTNIGQQMDIGSTIDEPPLLSDDVGMVLVELVRAQKRKRSSDEIINDIRTKVELIPGIKKMKFVKAQGGPAGADIQIEVRGDNLEEIVADTKKIENYLKTFKGVHDVEDNFRKGKQEIRIKLTPAGKALGLTFDDIAQQVHGAFDGMKASEVRLGSEDVDIKVMYPLKYRKNLSDIESFKIFTPGGKFVFLNQVANWKIMPGFTSVVRTDYKRAVTVRADVDYHFNDPQRVTNDVLSHFSYLNGKSSDVRLRAKGAKEEARKSMGSLMEAFGIAILVIYLILASLFRSYTQPLIVMSVIPFAVTGALWGHVLMGYNLAIISFIGIAALAGIVVNDSLVLVDYINRMIRRGVPLTEAVFQSGAARFRAIILTTITTIFGLLPILTETSLQARFLIPMAISITFGLAFATVLTLLMIPALYLILHDVLDFLSRYFLGRRLKVFGNEQD